MIWHVAMCLAWGVFAFICQRNGDDLYAGFGWLNVSIWSATMAL